MVDDYDSLYPFIYKGILTEESLDKAGREEKDSLSSNERTLIMEKLSFNMLDDDSITAAQRMALVYTAIHAFENMVRDLVKSVMVEEYKDNWWEEINTKIKDKVKKRIDDDSKFKWHGSRGGSEIEYCDFGDLSSIIIVQWDIFEITLADREWTKSILGVLERSRNIVMHGGVLAIQDIERIGGNIRDWVRQVG